MRLTTFSDYTLRVLMFLAAHPDRVVTIPEIAAAYAISEHHLTKVVHHLTRSAWIETTRGKGGGIRLAMPAEEIRIGAVIRHSEGEGAPVECLAEAQSACRIASVCRLSGILQAAFASFYAALDAYTLADLVVRPKKLQMLLRAES